LARGGVIEEVAMGCHGSALMVAMGESVVVGFDQSVGIELPEASLATSKLGDPKVLRSDKFAPNVTLSIRANRVVWLVRSRRTS
jgi:hypothetical protein